MKKFVQTLVLGLGIVTGSYAIAADVYTIDPVHSTLGFSVRHMMVSETLGSFGQFEGDIVVEPSDISASKTQVTIQAASIDTRQDKRDAHLRGADFFDVEKFPTITFVSKAITKSGEGYIITGDLTMKGVTKEVAIPVTITGPVGSVIGLAGSFTLNRQDYGITYNKTLDQGGLAVSNDVKVNINIEAKKK